MKPLMACGHTANAVSAEGEPTCVICIGIHPGATVVAQAQPQLEGREAVCGCGARQPSSFDLAFFEFRGEGSRVATETCKHCNYYESAHDPAHMESLVHRPSTGERRPTVIEMGRCPGPFEPHGAWETDIWYCGHSGWN